MTIPAATGPMAVLAAALLWATTGTAAALAPQVPSLAAGAAAMGIGGLLQAATALRLMRAHRFALAAQWRFVLVSAAAVAVYPLAFYTSMRLAGVAAGTVVSIGSAPPAAALIERIAGRRSLPMSWACGTALGLAGVAVLALAPRSGHGSAAADGNPVPGIALGLVAGFTYAAYSWGTARLMRAGIASRASMGAVFGIGGLALMPVLIATGGPILASGRNLAVIAYLACVPMFLGYVLFGRGLASVNASTATAITLAEPAGAALIAVIVLRERLTVPGWAGVTLLFVSLLFTTGLTRALRRPAHRTSPASSSGEPAAEAACREPAGDAALRRAVAPQPGPAQEPAISRSAATCDSNASRPAGVSASQVRGRLPA